MIAIIMQDGSIRRMQLAPDMPETADLVDDAIAKAPWAKGVKGWRFANPEEFPVGCTWRDDGGKIAGTPIDVTPPRDIAAELDALKAVLVSNAVITEAEMTAETAAPANTTGAT